jgi:hypothetical protein
MCRQEDTCWRCGARWVNQTGLPATLSVLAGGASADPLRSEREAARALAEEAEGRWADEGGSVIADASAQRAAVGSR